MTVSGTGWLAEAGQEIGCLGANRQGVLHSLPRLLLKGADRRLARRLVRSKPVPAIGAVRRLVLVRTMASKYLESAL